MSEITQENIHTLDEKIIVTLSPDDYQADYEQSIKDYSKRAELKGFKKGKVPKALVKKMYGKNLLADQLMRQSYMEATTYVKDKDLDIFAQPMMVDTPDFTGDLNTETDYTFGFEIGLRPTFDIPLLEGDQSFEKLQVETTDEMVEDDVERLRNRMGEMTNPDTVEDDNTVLNVHMQEVDADGNPVEGSEPVENSFLLSYIDESARPQFMGKKVGDSVVIKFGDTFSDKLTKPMATDLSLDPDNEEDLNKSYKVTIDKIGYVKKSDLDEEFFDKVFPGKEITTEEEFKTQIKEDIQNQWEDASLNVLDNYLYEALVHETDITLPDEFLKKWLQYKDETPMTEEELTAAYPTFQHQLKWTVISDKIIKENDIKVEESEVKDAIEQQVRGYFGMNAGMQEEWLDDFIQKTMNDSDQYQKTANEIMAKKVMAIARSKVSLDTEKVTADEFKTKSEEYSHKYHNH